VRHIKKDLATQAVTPGKLFSDKTLRWTGLPMRVFFGLDQRFKAGASSEIHPHSNKAI
jgi:hypothetical protein